MNKYKVQCSNSDFEKVKDTKVYNIKVDGEKTIFYTNTIKNLDDSFLIENIFINKIKVLTRRYIVTLIGIIFFLFVIFIINKSVIYIEINSEISNEQETEKVYNYVNEKLKYYGKIGFLKENIHEINKAIKKDFYMYEWINVEKKGVYLIINISKVNSDYVNPEYSDQDIIYSKYNAFVRGYYVRSGKILVTNNSSVSSGDALITGLVPSYGDKIIKVRPSGYVIGEVSYYEKLTLEKEKKQRKRSGKVNKIRKYVWFGKNINHKCGYEEYDIEIKEIFSLNKLLKVYDIYYYEVVNENIVYTLNDAITYGKSLIYNNFSKKKKYDFEKILSIDIQYTDTSDNYYTISFLVNMIKDITN